MYPRFSGTGDWTISSTDGGSMNRKDINIRDPFVLVDHGRYYLYGTRGPTCWGPADGFDVYTGTDLEHWEGPTVCFQREDGFFADRNFWAPEVHVWHGRYYMFASFKSDSIRRGTAILCADSPMGPFRLLSDGPVTPPDWECLDGTFYVEDGTPYLVFCHEWVQVGDGEILAMPLTSDLSRPAGDPVLLFHASDAPWAKQMHHSSGMDGYVTDGPFLHRTRDGQLLMLFSSFSESGYTQGLARSVTGKLSGPWEQLEPLFRENGGHGMLFRSLEDTLLLTLHTPNVHLQEHPWFCVIRETPDGLKPDREGFWENPMRARLHTMAEELKSDLQPRPLPEKTCTLSPDTQGGLMTARIQECIDTLSLSGGGTVRFLPGTYLTGSLTLRSGVTLKLEQDAHLLASTDLADYPEHIAQRYTIQDEHMGMNQCLIFAEGADHIGLCGPGTIDGQGTRANFPGDETCDGTPGRPFLIRFVDCSDVQVRNITLRNSPCWMQNYFHCHRVLLDHVTVRSQVNYNNDGIDLDGCTDVYVHDCSVHSGDDALCFKGASERETSRVLVEDCELLSSCNALKIGTDTQADFRDILVRRCSLGGVREDPGGLKHPWSDSGISLEMVDGAFLGCMLLEDLTIDRALSPVFMCLMDRGRVRRGLPAPGPGRMERIIISGVTGSGNGPRGSYVFGRSTDCIRDLVLENADLAQKAHEGALPAEPEQAVLETLYPDAHMIDPAPAPAYALWARDVINLSLRSWHVTPEEGETRPEILFTHCIREDS